MIPSVHPAAARSRAFSFTEVLVTIAIIGIMTAIAIPSITRTDQAAKAEVANQIVTSINRAISAYRQCASEITLNANSDTGEDEASIMALLTVADSGVVGSPFLHGPKWPHAESADDATYRVRWNGRFFEVLPPGTAGTGLKVNGI